VIDKIPGINEAIDQLSISMSDTQSTATQTAGASVSTSGDNVNNEVENNVEVKVDNRGQGDVDERRIAKIVNDELQSEFGRKS